MVALVQFFLYIYIYIAAATVAGISMFEFENMCPGGPVKAETQHIKYTHSCVCIYLECLHSAVPAYYMHIQYLLLVGLLIEVCKVHLSF